MKWLNRGKNVKNMDDLTLGIIYAVKHGNKSGKESIIDFLSEYTATPKQHYSDRELVRIIRDTFVDYLKTADNPAFDVWQYFDAKRQQENFKDVFPEQHKKYAERDNCMDIDTEAIISAFRLACVQENGKYVNGFKDWKEHKQ